MSKPMFGEHSSKRQRELCLQYAAELRASQHAPITPAAVTRICIARDLFSDAQMAAFQFDGTRRQVERWLKTRDETGLETWAQLPLTDEDGEKFWEQRQDMAVTGYAWNYLLRDDQIESTTERREQWRKEGLHRFGAKLFNAEVARLKRERRRKAS
jgi:hypothetical protein